MRKKHIELFKDAENQYRIRLVAPNGEILMSSEAYSSRTQAMDTAISIQQDFVYFLGIIEVNL